VGRCRGPSEARGTSRRPMRAAGEGVPPSLPAECPARESGGPDDGNRHVPPKQASTPIRDPGGVVGLR
jgi:hypothetical protein